MTHSEGDEYRSTYIDFGHDLGVLSRAAFELHAIACLHSIEHGPPRVVSDDYLNTLAMETTVAVAELETAGIWQRRTNGYLIVADDVLRMMSKFNGE